MAEKNYEVRLRINKEGELEAFKEVADDVGLIDPAAKDAEKAVEKLAGAVERSGSASDSALTRAKRAVDDYRAALDRAREAGEDIGEGQAGKLKELEDRYERLTDRTKEFREAQREVKASLGETSDEIGRNAGEVRGLDDVIKEIGAELGPQATKWVSWGVAAAGAFVVGYEAGEKFRQMANDLSGGVLDELIQKYNPLIRAATALAEGQDRSGVSAQELANRLNILAKNGIDVAGKSAEEVNALFEQFTSGLRDNAAASQEADAAYQKWRESLPPTSEELQKLGEQLLKNIERLKETETSLSDVELEAIIRPQVEALLAQLERLPEGAKAGVEGMIAELQRLAGVTSQTTGQMASQWGTTKEEIAASLQALRDRLSPIPDDLAALAEANGLAVGAWERHNEVLSLTPSKVKEAGDAAREAGDKASEGAAGLAEQGKAAQDAAAGLCEAGRAAGEAGAGLETAAAGAERLGQAAPAVATTAEALAKMSGVDLSNVGSQLGSISTELDALLTKAQNTAAAIRSIANAGDGGGAEAPA